MDITEFFDRYAEALVARDAATLARLYGTPSLVLFPRSAGDHDSAGTTEIPVTDERQTEAFFASSFAQYEGVSEAVPRIRVLARTAAAVWADVTWSWDGVPRERFCYQLAATGQGWRVAVLTPLDGD